ncbi:MAG: penicillin-binding transpeptidase domain-containing protein [bacterium]
MSNNKSNRDSKTGTRNNNRNTRNNNRQNPRNNNRNSSSSNGRNSSNNRSNSGNSGNRGNNNRTRNMSSGSTNNARKTRQNNLATRIIILALFTIVPLFVIGIGRVTYIKANNGEEFEQQAIQNQVNKVQDKIVNPNRGSILDRNGQAIALSSTVFNIILDIRVVAQQKEEAILSTIEIISRILEIDHQTLEDYFVRDANGNLKPENDTNWKVIEKKVSYSKAKQLEQELSALSLRGVHLETDTMRSYTQDDFASQVIGFIRGDTKWGLEYQYDSEMAGIAGRVYRTYEDTEYFVTNDIEPIQGNNIITTLDLELQTKAQEIVESTYKQYEGTYTPESVQMILMNPATGEILSMAQYPTFDSNDPDDTSFFEESYLYKNTFFTLSQFEQLELKNTVWKNLAITNAYENGSTFKANVVAAGLEEGVVNENEVFYCGGYKEIGGYTIRCHLRSGHGNITLTESLAKSCNMVMIDIANRLGRETFYDYQRDFGFGQLTGIDLYGEVSAASLMVAVENLNSTELATSAFGQTFSSTPIQALVAFAATINGGNIMKPYVVSQITDSDGKVLEEKSPEIVRKVLSTSTSDYLRKAMVTTLITGGTGYRAEIPGYDIGGKTGTAQQGDRSKDIYTLSFAAYLPADDPQYLALAIINKPENYIDAPSGEVSPAYMMKDYLEAIIEYKAIPPNNPDQISNITAENLNNDSKILSDYINKSVKSTIDEFNKLGIDFQLVGSAGDIVVQQIPIGNTKIDKTTKVLLYIGDSGDEEKDISLTPIPNVLGLSEEDAKNLVESMGFEVIISKVDSNYLEYETINLKEELLTLEPTSVLTTEEIPENQDNTEETTEEITEETTEETTQIPTQSSNGKVVDQMPQSGIYIEEGSIIKIKVSS